jgi:hypothetical protein
MIELKSEILPRFRAATGVVICPHGEDKGDVIAAS